MFIAWTRNIGIRKFIMRWRTGPEKLFLAITRILVEIFVHDAYPSHHGAQHNVMGDFNREGLGFKVNLSLPAMRVTMAQLRRCFAAKCSNFVLHRALKIRTAYQTGRFLIRV